jgi:cAMP phosphodiesterase
LKALLLIKNNDAYVLYLGILEQIILKSNKLHLLWEAIAPLIKKKQLKEFL